MYYKGNEVPIIFFYKAGKLVFGYALPEGLERTEHGFRVSKSFPDENSPSSNREVGSVAKCGDRTP